MGGKEVQVDINTVIRKLSFQIADLIAERTVLETQNEALQKELSELKSGKGDE